MTRREKLTAAIEAWCAGRFEAQAPEANQFAFLRAAIAAGFLPKGNLRSYASVLRTMVTPDDAPEPDTAPEAFPNMVRRHVRRYVLTEGEDGDRYYVFYAKDPFRIPEKGVEEMKRAYANKPYGLGWTINQVCMHFGIGRADFQFVRSQLGWTHDQDEFTREEHLELDTEQLLEDREQRSRWLLHQKEKERSVAEAFEKAAKWDKAVGDYLAMGNTATIAPQTLEDAFHDRPLVVIPLADFHIENEQDTQHKLAGIADILDTVPWNSHVLLVFQGDWFHFDTYERTTTRGTLVGSERPEDMVRAAYAAAKSVIELVRAEFSFDVAVVAGNHDRMQTIGFSIWLEDYVGQRPHIVQAVGGLELVEVRYGRNRLWFEHGDGGRGKIENIVMKAIAVFGRQPEDFVALYTGHLHHHAVKDVAGVMCFQLTTPEKKKNDWEEKSGYHSNAGIRVDVYDKKRALMATHWRWV